MNGVQAAVIGGSAMILLVLVLRLFLKSICRAGSFRRSGAQPLCGCCSPSPFRRA